jgi:hypothetical protein
MVTLTPGKTVSSRDPDLLVENVLAPGRWRFQLVVVDDEKNESEPVELVVQVDPLRPGRPRDPIVEPARPVRPLHTVINPVRPVRPVEPVIDPIRPVIPVVRPR